MENQQVSRFPLIIQSQFSCRINEGAYFVHRGAPEVIDEHILQRSVLPQIAVILYRADVVENKAAIECIVIAENASQRYRRTINV